MSNVYFPKGAIQRRSAPGNSHAFDIPKEHQGAVQLVLDALADTDCIHLSLAAANIINHTYISDDYTSNIYICVDGRRYVIYARDGEFRVGAGGEMCSSRKLAEEDKQAIIDHFANVNLEEV